MLSNAVPSPFPAGLRTRAPLTRGWTLRPVDPAVWKHTGASGPIPATVPGGVHADLLDAERIPDPFVDRNELEVTWVADADWIYRTTFGCEALPPEGCRLDLVCEGLDTFATVRLNGHVIGTSDSMHVSHQLDTRSALRAGENELEIEFASPTAVLERLVAEHGELPHQGHGSNTPIAHNIMRKMSCAFGWDWGPVMPTSGIWRPIWLDAWGPARLGQPRVLAMEVSPERATLRVVPDVAVSTPCGVDARVTVLDPDGEPIANGSAEWSASPDDNASPRTIDITIDKPELWWPVGHGDQPLYSVDIELLADGERTDAASIRTGVRKVELITDADGPDVEPPSEPEGTPRTFHFRINGRRVFCKGANWIPDDLTPGRIEPERYRMRVEQARKANMNMLRVWGGGVYESNSFYEACDELGIMVWQDFLCACAAYHEHEPYRSWFEAEARDNIPRLASHPSLVLWCGNNECHEAVQHWGEFEPLRDDPSIPWGRKLYEELFPAIVAELDPSRPYWPGSPFTIAEDGNVDVENPRRDDSGDQHIWDVWNGQGDAKWYLTHAPRFASEFGFHGPPTWSTLARTIPEDQRRYDSPAMIHHNKHAGGQPLANTRMADYFDPPRDFDDWLYLAQVVQARSLELGCAWFRALSPWCSGALYWQLNDIWPVSSWAAIDSEGKPKPLWYATRRFFRPRLITIRPARPLESGDERAPLAVYLHNDSREAWSAEVLVEARNESGLGAQTLLEQAVRVAPGEVERIDLPGDTQLDQGMLVARAQGNAGTERAFWFPKPDREITYPLPLADFELERTGQDHEIHIHARSLIRDLCIFPDRLHPDASVSDQLITMLPGDETTLWVRSPVPLDITALTRPPVMRSANHFGAPVVAAGH